MIQLNAWLIHRLFFYGLGWLANWLNRLWSDCLAKWLRRPGWMADCVGGGLAGGLNWQCEWVSSMMAN